MNGGLLRRISNENGCRKYSQFTLVKYFLVFERGDFLIA
jgi:hypothetical protein